VIRGYSQIGSHGPRLSVVFPDPVQVVVSPQVETLPSHSTVLSTPGLFRGRGLIFFQSGA
jgi:hypothetical protein